MANTYCRNGRYPAVPGPWDLVLTDVEMPGMAGLQLLEALRQVAPALSVAVITAHAAAGPVTDTLRKDANEFLEKPVRPDRLIAVATALISKARGEQVRRREREAGLRTERP